MQEQYELLGMISMNTTMLWPSMLLEQSCYPCRTDAWYHSTFPPLSAQLYLSSIAQQQTLKMYKSNIVYIEGSVAYGVCQAGCVGFVTAYCAPADE